MTCRLRGCSCSETAANVSAGTAHMNRASSVTSVFAGRDPAQSFSCVQPGPTGHYLCACMACRRLLPTRQPCALQASQIVGLCATVPEPFTLCIDADMQAWTSCAPTLRPSSCRAPRCSRSRWTTCLMRQQSSAASTGRAGRCGLVCLYSAVAAVLCAQ